jgi:hypothetical protein
LEAKVLAMTVRIDHCTENRSQPLRACGKGCRFRGDIVFNRHEFAGDDD